ncbi:MAG: hypothetical protein KIT84_07235 [Labilithrix sp.]|nr:hypothetical protein [Labilithrix sp.]MCW5810788.1 hypothetical protein [Labilithrix sp.]
MRIRSAASAAGFALLLLASSASSAPTKPDPAAAAKKAECVAALDKAQESRAGRKLTEARASYVTCSHEQCPDMIREDCTKGLREVDEALPSITLAASIDGHDAHDATVSLDGTPIEGGLDGRSIPLDPGSHSARFERPGSPPIEVKITAREGQKNQLITGTFPGTKAASDKAVATEGSKFPIVPIAFAGTGVVALGAAFFMHLDMTSRANELGNTCAPSCSQSDRDSLSDRLVLRNVALGIGIGALVVAAVTYVVTLKR